MSTQPPSVRFETGQGGLPVVRVTAPGSSAEIYLHGAHLTSWVPQGQQPVVWLSAESRFDTSAAIRGGVPICFPWFGARTGHPEAPQHGFARLSDWTLVDAEELATLMDTLHYEVLCGVGARVPRLLVP